MKLPGQCISIIIFGIIASSTVPAYGYGAHQQSYRVNRGETVPVDEPDLCQQVTNNGPSDLFIPTNTADEWSRFRESVNNGLVPGVSLSDCGPSGPVCGDGICDPSECSCELDCPCTEWQKGSCGNGINCPPTSMVYTRFCNCGMQTKCEVDSSCCLITPQSCGGAGNGVDCTNPARWYVMKQCGNNPPEYLCTGPCGLPRCPGDSCPEGEICLYQECPEGQQCCYTWDCSTFCLPTGTPCPWGDTPWCK
jgi:hypothetical protein